MNWTGRRVLVTGAGGFIGSHLCERLVREGADVTAFVRYTSRGGLGLLQLLDPALRVHLRTVSGDLRDPGAVRTAVRGQSVVFHLGALIAIPYSYLHPTEVADVNVIGTLNVLNAARDEEIERVVHTSTSEVYGTAVTVPIAETHPLQAQSPYSASKIGADALAHSYYCAFELPVAILRPFNTYGPRQSGRAVIPTIVGQALRGEAVCLGAVEPTRDFTFVEDTVTGFLAIADCADAVGRVISVGTGTEISIGDLARAIVDRVGRNVPIVLDEQRLRPSASEVLRLVCDASLARRVLGWRPRVGLDEGLDRMIAFLKAHPNWTRPETYEV